MDDVFDVKLIQKANGFKIAGLRGKQLKDLPLEYTISQRSKVYMNDTLNGSGMILSINHETIRFHKDEFITKENAILLIMSIKESNRILEEIYARPIDFDFEEYVIGVEEVD